MNTRRKISVGIHKTGGLFSYNFNDDGSVELTDGFEKELLEIYSSTLDADVEYRIPPVEVTWGRPLPNGSWTGVMGMLHRSEVDFIMGALLLRDDRFKIGDPTFPYKFEEVRFITRLPNLQSKTLVFVEPFIFDVWIAIFTSLLLVALFLFWITKRHKKHTFQEQLFSLTALLLQQGAEVEPASTFVNRMPFIAWAIVAQLLSLSYMSVLLSFMTVPRREAVVDTVDKLLGAVKNNKFRVTVPHDIPLYLQWLLSSQSAENKELGQYIVKHNYPIHFNGPELITALLKGYAAVFPLFGKSLFLRGSVIVSKDIFFSGGLVLYARKTFCCLDRLNRAVLGVAAGGIYEKILDHYIFRRHLKLNMHGINELDENIESIKTLTLEDLKGCFLLFILGILISLIIFGIEIMFYKMSLNGSTKMINIRKKFHQICHYEAPEEPEKANESDSHEKNLGKNVKVSENEQTNDLKSGLSAKRVTNKEENKTTNGEEQCMIPSLEVAYASSDQLINKRKKASAEEM